ncbi:hypothetical protein FB451DRAFT_1187545 [Mycena latifolia]|nr:hypothetical protein FB451DRAFT_1187545 [Mycena latifolia]
MPAEKPKILCSASYWHDFHRSRAERRARIARGAPVNEEDGPPMYDSSTIYTFVPHRILPLVGFQQRDGSIIPAQNPPPPVPANAPHATGTIFYAPSSIGVKTHRHRAAEIERWARAIMDARPDADTLLLARLAKNSTQAERAPCQPEQMRDAEWRRQVLQAALHRHTAPLVGGAWVAGNVARSSVLVVFLNEMRGAFTTIAIEHRETHPGQTRRVGGNEDERALEWQCCPNAEGSWLKGSEGALSPD